MKPPSSRGASLQVVTTISLSEVTPPQNPRADRVSTPAAFFFFQAEDGIRDALVTGVQTCALPIFSGWTSTPSEDDSASDTSSTEVGRPVPRRSEERRVGKECRSRWSPVHSKH